MSGNDQFSNLQRDSQLAGNPEDAVGEHIDSALKDTHTCIPGIIESFDKDKQTCQAQPAIQRIWTDKGPMNLPLCVDCPVAFPGGGGFFLTFPVEAGDECMIHFSERCIDNWYASGVIAAPADYRMHDLSDGMCVVGINNQAKAISNFSMDGVQLRSRDGQQSISLNTNGTFKVEITSEGSVSMPGGWRTDAPSAEFSDNVSVGNGATGIITALTCATVQNGIVINIA